MEEKKKTRNWFLTLNNYTDLEYTAFMDERTYCGYLLIAKEVGNECNTPHLHVILMYINARHFDALKKKFPRARIEVMKGTAEDARNYCIKDGDFVEFGQLPKQGKRNDIQEVREMVEKGANMRTVASRAHNYQSLRIAEFMMKYFETPRNSAVYVEYYYGKTGTGKTIDAYKAFEGKDYYVCTMDKWFEGYDGQTNVIMDEFRDRRMPYEALLQLTDRYQYRVECKGASRQFKGTHIIFTSHIHPEELYGDLGEDKGQFLRRINVIRHYTKLNTYRSFYWSTVQQEYINL